MTQKTKLISIAAFLISCCLLFFRLGHYALWDDEAGTALSAIGVWQTGDTTALLGHNLVAYESGEALDHFHERFMPPLPAYLAAPFIGLLGQTSFAARLPFALCGAVCTGFMLWWIWKKNNPVLLIFFVVALLTNVSFFLFFRQCRYYGLSMLLPLILAFLYASWDGSRKRFLIFIVCSLCLFASNYLNCVAVYLCLAVDYFVWGRKRYRLTVSDLGILLIPQLIIGGIIFSIWNPIVRQASVAPFPEVNRLEYIWWCIRDITICEFGVTVFVLLALVLAVKKQFATKDPNTSDCHWMLRACVCAVIFVLATAVLIPHPPSLRGVAATRYFVPAIPLFILISALVLNELWQKARLLSLLLAMGAFSTNAFNGGLFLDKHFNVVSVHLPNSALLKFLAELRNPPNDPFSVTAEWINKNIAEQESLWVMPDYAAYPLMYHAPKPIYAWQLTWPPREDFKSLQEIHFIGRVPPQYIIAFGPALETVRMSLSSWHRPDLKYDRIATIDHFWKDLHRPELFWRSFERTTNYDRNSEAIAVFKLRSSTNARAAGAKKDY